jgi:hypothetical protein
MWSNDDAFNDKPMFPVERQVRAAPNANNNNSPIQLTVATTVIASGNGNSAITFVGANSAMNAGVTAGMYVYDTSLYNTVSFMGDDPGISNHIDFFFSNNTVLSVTNGNVVTLSANVINNVLAGNVIAFGTAINYGNTAGANTYTQDTILITPTRSANNTTGTGAIANVGNLNAGWNHIQKKVNNDGTVRYLKETLVALSSPTAANTNSGNTSFGQFVSGL